MHNAVVTDSDPHTYVRIQRNLTVILAAVDQSVTRFVKVHRTGRLCADFSAHSMGALTQRKKRYEHL